METVSTDNRVSGTTELKIQQILPQQYAEASDSELDQRITEAKKALGKDVVILGHHYQRDEIIKFADYTGDSLKLSQHAASHPEANYIVFCGVHFMAESADILAAPHQRVILPNLTAGCSMADMASLEQVEDAWDEIARVSDKKASVVTYMNCSAAIKSFTGQKGGAVCTSSNCGKVLAWAWSQAEQILFLPDEHLGRNTALAMGLTEHEMTVWDPLIPSILNDMDAVKRSKLILWKGFCSVHGRFSVEQVERARRDFPGIRVVVHPECRREVVEAADSYGSTEFIVKEVNAAPPGSKFAIGTEINLVSRLAKEHPDKLIFCLDPIVCPCSTMYRIHPSYLCWVLEELLDGRVVNEIVVPDRDIQYAKLALDRMLQLS